MKKIKVTAEERAQDVINWLEVGIARNMGWTGDNSDFYRHQIANNFSYPITNLKLKLTAFFEQWETESFARDAEHFAAARPPREEQP